MNIFCRACKQRVLTDDLCPHREPVCWGCCPDEHVTYYDDPEGDAA